MTMGLYPRLASAIFDDVARGNSSLPLRLVSSETVLKDTSIMFVDLTQYLFVSATMKMSGLYRKEIHYDSCHEFLNCDDPIGEVRRDERTGRVTNMLDSFHADLPGCLLARRIELLESQWRMTCDTRGISSNLRTIILVVDGDSPPAKSRTRKKRSNQSSATALLKLVRLWCKEPFDEDSLQQRMFASHIESDGRTVTSLQRFMCHRKNRDDIVSQMISTLKKNTYINSTLYVSRGRCHDTQNDQMIRVSGIHMHLSRLPDSIPYFEADSIIPYLWSYVKEQENCAVVVTRDSDMLVTMLSMDDPKFHLLCNVSGSFVNDDLVFFDNKVAMKTDREKLPSSNLHLQILLHLTMGGCDYAENFPRLGVVGIMTGLDCILNGRRVPFCIKRVTWREVKDKGEDGECVSFDHDSIQVGGEAWHRLREIVASDDHLFPIRLGDRVIVIRLDESLVRETVAWYKARCKGKGKSVGDEESRAFVMGMRRRLFFLSMVTECRFGLELDMCWQSDVAKKCGYDDTNDFAYMK